MEGLLGEGDSGANEKADAFCSEQSEHDSGPVGKEGASAVAQASHEIDDEDKDSRHRALDGQI